MLDLFRDGREFIIVSGLQRDSLNQTVTLMIHVIATIRTAAGRRDDFLAAFRELVPLVKAERGCLEYGPAVDLDARIDGQPAIREDVVTVIEKWETPDALKDHLAAPHMNRYREQMKEIVDGVEIRVMEPAD